jgi:putative restriction endonuclease
MSESVIERELAIRLAAMDWLAAFGPEQTFRYEQLAQFQFQGDRLPLTDRGRGIRKPAQMTAALSFSTVYTAPNAVPPYEDTEGRDGLLRYKIRGEDPRHPDNVAMRAAQERQLPLIWFVGVAPGLYLPRYPVYLVGEEHGQFVVALDQAQRNLAAGPGAQVSEDDRRYAEAITRRRLHQPLFRARVLQAYESRCSMCHLRHASLLDASHILDDKHALGQPVVPNGLALCKIHHAGFDQNIIGVSPDLRISVRRDILDEVDGPMLKYGIQALEGQRLTVPKQRVAAPDRERLAVRFADFQSAVA